MRARLAALLCCASATLATADDTIIVPGSSTTGYHGHALSWIDPVGTPIAIVEMDVIPGLWYELQTFDLRPIAPIFATPDTVITVRDGATTDATTIAGADVCETAGAEPDERASCVRFFVDPMVYPVRRTLYVWIRATLQGHRGTADVRMQRLLTEHDIPDPDACDLADEFRCWDLVTNDRPFGGLTVLYPGPDVAGLLHLETTALPAPDEHESMILLVPGNLVDPERNWQIASDVRGGPGSHRSGAPGAAEWIGIGAEVGITNEASLLASTTAWFAAPIRLVRNDRVVYDRLDGTHFIAGTDFDGDTIGADLERVLRTCDSRSTPAAGGIPCGERPGCAGDPGSALCKASLRDSDGDALRDDHELYGVAVDGSGALTELPRFGADPARFDIFLEIDRQPIGCEPGVTHAPYTNVELRDLARMWRTIPDFANRDGTNGIYLHADTGTTPDNPAESAHGRWGGANIAAATATHGDSMRASRRFLFRHFFHRCTGAVAHAGIHASHGVLTRSTSFTHELGHTGGLDHGGPDGFDGQSNYKPNHWSQMNYLFENITTGHFGETPPNRAFTDLVFSTGQFANRPMNPRAVDEACPFGPGVDTSFARRLFGTYYTEDEHPGCLSVDWNHDGEIAPPGELVEAPLMIAGRRARATRVTRAQARTVTGGDLAIGGDNLYWAYLRIEDGSRKLAVRINRGMFCNECDVGLRPCWDPLLTDRDVDLADDRAISVAIAARLGADSEPLALVVYNTSDGRLHHGLLRGNAAVWTYLGIVPNALVGGPIQSQFPDAAAFGNGFVISYRAGGDRVVTQAASLVGADLVWAKPVPMLDTDGVPMVPLGDSSPAIGVVDVPGLGQRLAIAMEETFGLITGLTIRIRNDDTRWSRITSVITGSPLALDDRTGVQGRPSFAQVDYGNGPVVAVAWLGATARYENELMFRRLRLPGSTIPWESNEVGEVGGHSPLFGGVETLKAPHTMPLVFDTRGAPALWGLRGVYFEWLKCDNANGTDCPAAASACIDPSAGVDPDTTSETCHGADPEIVGGREYFLPFADGIFAGRLYDFDERPALRHGLCRALRTCEKDYEDFADPACIPAQFADLDGSGVPIREQTCAPQSGYAPVCDPIVEDRDGDGIPDEVDRCPDSEGVFFDRLRDGCPDDLDDIVDFGEREIVPRLREHIALANPAAAAAMQKAIDYLIKTKKGSSGMLDELRAAAWLAAGTQARSVVLALYDASAAGFDTKREQVEVVETYREALALKLKPYALAIGDDLRKQGDFEGAVIAYRDAASKI